MLLVRNLDVHAPHPLGRPDLLLAAGQILRVDPAERKIGLSVRALKSDEYRADWDTYSAESGSGLGTLGDHFRHNQ